MTCADSVGSVPAGEFCWLPSHGMPYYEVLISFSIIIRSVRPPVDSDRGRRTVDEEARNRGQTVPHPFQDDLAVCPIDQHQQYR